MLKKLWTDPVWSKVLAAAIVSAGSAICAYLFGFWPAINTGLATGLGYINSSSETPNWLLLLLGIAAIPSLLLIVAACWNLFFFREAGREINAQQGWLTYTSDRFYGLRWRWKYRAGRVVDLHTFCPYCDYQVFPHNASSFSAVDHLAFKCDSFSRELANIQEPYSHFESKVERFIHQKLRNNTWSATDDK